MTDPLQFVKWLEEFDVFYRGIGLLDIGFRFTQAERAAAAAPLSRWGDFEDIRSKPRLRLLYELALTFPEVNEMEILAKTEGASVVSHGRKNISYGALCYALMPISHGCFTPTDFTWDSHDEGVHEIRCTLDGVARCAFLPRFKWLDDHVFVELNRWIEDSGRRFATVGCTRYDDPIFACLDARQIDALEERGLHVSITTEWDEHPRHLLPLAERLAVDGDFDALLRLTSFHPELGDLAPELHYYRGVAKRGLGRAEVAYLDIHAAKRHGMADALERFEESAT